MEKNPSNQSIDRMFQIIEAMAFTGKPMRLNDIAEKSGIPASTAMRILNAMIENGYASQNEETQLYNLSYKFLWVGNSIRENLSLNQLLHPYLQEISKRTALGSALSVLNGDTITYVDEVIDTRQMLRVYHQLGHSFPLYITACGKIFLSGMSAGERSRYYQRENLIAQTPKTLCTRAELESDVEKVLTLGYAVNDEEGLLGMRYIALPVNSSDGRIFAAISISGTIYQITHDNIPLLASTMRQVLAKLYEDCRPIFSSMLTAELL